MSGYAEYAREWRAKNPDSYTYNKLTRLARERALRALARAHPEEIRRLVNIERERAGLPPLGVQGSPQYAPKRRSPTRSNGEQSA